MCFKVLNPESIYQDWLLTVSSAFMESMNLFVLHENGESESISSDHRFSFTQRPVDTRFFVVPFKLLPQAMTKDFLRSISDNGLSLNLMWGSQRSVRISI